VRNYLVAFLLFFFFFFFLNLNRSHCFVLPLVNQLSARLSARIRDEDNQTLSFLHKNDIITQDHISIRSDRNDIISGGTIFHRAAHLCDCGYLCEHRRSYPAGIITSSNNVPSAWKPRVNYARSSARVNDAPGGSASRLQRALTMLHR